MFSTAVHVKFTQTEIYSTKIQCCIKAYLLQKIVGHVMFGTCLRLLGLEESHGVVNNSPCYRVSAAFFYGQTSALAWSRGVVPGERHYYKVVVCAVPGAPLLRVMDCQQDQGKISTRQKGIKRPVDTSLGPRNGGTCARVDG